MGAIPDVPAIAALQIDATSLPIAHKAPIPVTTTRRRWGVFGGEVSRVISVVMQKSFGVRLRFFREMEGRMEFTESRPIIPPEAVAVRVESMAHKVLP
jgi:hypothetical protein